MPIMEHPPSPRIHAQHLQMFAYKHVRIVGRITGLHGQTATIDAGGSITLHQHPEDHLKMGNAAEIIGKVEQDLTVRVLRSQDLGENFDYNVANAVVDAWHRFNEIYYDKDNDVSNY